MFEIRVSTILILHLNEKCLCNTEDAKLILVKLKFDEHNKSSGLLNEDVIF